MPRAIVSQTPRPKNAIDMQAHNTPSMNRADMDDTGDEIISIDNFCSFVLFLFLSSTHSHACVARTPPYD